MLIKLTIMHDAFRSMVLFDGHQNLSILFSLIDKVVCQFCLKLSRYIILQTYMIISKILIYFLLIFYSKLINLHIYYVVKFR